MWDFHPTFLNIRTKKQIETLRIHIFSQKKKKEKKKKKLLELPVF